MKKTLVIAILTFSVLSLSSFAEIKNENKEYFRGIYLGANLGYDYISKSDIKKSLDAIPTIGKELQNAGNLSGTIGYGYIFNKNIYLGIEADVGYRFNSKGSTTWFSEDIQSNITATFTAPLSFGITFKGGYLLCPKTLVYGLIGYTALNTNSKISVPEFNLNGNASAVLNGFKIGAGIERILIDSNDFNVSGNLEIFYKRYVSVSSVKSSGDLSEAASIAIKDLKNLNGFNVSAGLKFRFTGI